MKHRLRIKVRLVGELAAKYGEYVVLEFDSEPSPKLFMKVLSSRLSMSESSIMRDFMIVINGKTRMPEKISSDDTIEVIPIFFGG